MRSLSMNLAVLKFSSVTVTHYLAAIRTKSTKITSDSHLHYFKSDIAMSSSFFILDNNEFISEMSHCVEKIHYD